MADTTFVVDLPANRWTLIADGADYSSVGLQMGSQLGVLIFVGEAKPEINATGYIALTDDGTRELVIDVPSDQQVYGRGQSRASSVRGYRVAVA